jgi:hypothetical protein
MLRSINTFYKEVPVSVSIRQNIGPFTQRPACIFVRKSFVPHYMLLIEEILLSKVCGENQNVSFIASRMI